MLGMKTWSSLLQTLNYLQVMHVLPHRLYPRHPVNSEEKAIDFFFK